MVKINLSRIHFRPYSDSEVPTEYGFGDHVETPGSIDLSNIQFRPWEDPGYRSIGGSGSLDPGGGGGDPGGGGAGEDPGGVELGTYAAFIDGITTTAYAYKNFTPGQDVYARIAIYISSAQMAAFLASGQEYSGEPLEIAASNDPANPINGLFFTDRNSSGTIDGNMYIWNYYTNAASKIQVTPDVWHIAEVAIRWNGSSLEGAWKWDGVLSSWELIFYGGTLTTLVVGANYGSGSYNDWYIDNAMYSTVNWISDGGTIAFNDGFETGDFSNWTGTSGTITLITPP